MTYQVVTIDQKTKEVKSSVSVDSREEAVKLEILYNVTETTNPDRIAEARYKGEKI